MRPVVVVGDVVADVVATASGPLRRGTDVPAAVALLGGGGAANAACWLAVAGVEVALVGRVGDDDLARVAAGDLPAYGVDARLAVDPHRPTGTCVVVVEPDGERTMLPAAGASGALSPADLPAALFRPGSHLHLSGYALLREGSRDAARTALARAAATRMTVSVDAASVGPLEAAGAEAFLADTAGAALLLANADEARLLTGLADPRAAAQRLADAYREVVVKVGPAGALWHDGLVGARAPAEPVEGPVDTTGAGDAFAAGFLAEWLLHPEPETALAAGCRLAARAVGVVGGRPPLPRR